MQYSDDTREILLAAGGIARSMGHSYVGSAHLLIALAQCRGIAGHLLRCGGMDIATAESVLTLLYGSGSEQIPLSLGFSMQAKKILRAAGREAHMQERRLVQPIHILFGVLRTEKNSGQRNYAA